MRYLEGADNTSSPCFFFERMLLKLKEFTVKKQLYTDKNNHAQIDLYTTDTTDIMYNEHKTRS